MRWPEECVGDGDGREVGVVVDERISHQRGGGQRAAAPMRQQVKAKRQARATDPPGFLPGWVTRGKTTERHTTHPQCCCSLLPAMCGAAGLWRVRQANGDEGRNSSGEAEAPMPGHCRRILAALRSTVSECGQAALISSDAQGPPLAW
jgi:hypothetical protein